jgi:hypothetical protein
LQKEVVPGRDSSGGESLAFGNVTGTRGKASIGSIKKMHRSKDVRALVRSLEDSPPNITPYILDYLNEYEGIGFLNPMIEVGLPEMFAKIMGEDWPISKRKAVKLLVNFITIEKAGPFLNEETTRNMVRMLPDADLDLKNWITYCLPAAISRGNGQVLIDEGTLPFLIEQLDSFDQYLVCISIIALDEMERAGFQWNMWRYNIAYKLRTLMQSEEPSIRCYAEDLNLKLEVWNNRTKSEGDVIKEEEKDFTVIRKEKKVNKKEEEMKHQSGNSAYVRPKAKTIPKKGAKKKTTISSTGRSSLTEEETLVELPSTSTKPLYDRLEGIKKPKVDDEEEDFEITL